MRTGALALLIFLAACGQSGGGANGAGAAGNMTGGLTAPGDERAAAATLTLAAAGPGGCSARWDGQPATPAQVLERSSALIEQAINGAGGIANLTEETTPAIAVVAPGELGFACADAYLSAIRRAGVPSVLLTPEGGEAALADFTLSDIGAPPPTVVLTIDAGRTAWNGETTAIEALPERLQRLAGGATDIEAPPGEVELRPAREANFGQVHAVLRAVRAGHVRAALLLPSVTPARPIAPAAAAPPAPAALSNGTGR